MKDEHGWKSQNRIGIDPPGSAIPGRTFALCGNRLGVNCALRRLAASGEILRVAPGIYVKPRHSALVGMVLPNSQEIAKVVTEAERTTFEPSGAAWVYNFRLTTQIMANPVYLTNGVSRRILLGKAFLTLRHA